MRRITVVVMRDGTPKMRLPLNQRDDGTLWSDAGSPLLNSTGIGAISKEEASIILSSKAWDRIPSGMYARMGINAGGLEVITADEYDGRILAGIKAAADRPGSGERRAIAALHDRASRIEMSDSEDNVMLPARLRSEADRRLAAWRTAYPDEARREDADDLDRKAEREETLARGALVYDADGTLSADDQQARHDEHMERASALRAEAASLRG